MGEESPKKTGAERFSEPTRKPGGGPPPPPVIPRSQPTSGPSLPPGLPRPPATSGPSGPKPARKRISFYGSAAAITTAAIFGVGYVAISNFTDNKSPTAAPPSGSSVTSPVAPSSQADRSTEPSTEPTLPPSPNADLGPLYEVISVTDGDTIRVDYQGQSEPVRFIGINTPESTNRIECFGKEASAFARKNLEGTKVYLVRDGMQDDRDRYGRLLRFVFLEDQTNFNATIVREGFGTFESQYPVAEPFRTELSDAQRQARNENIGLWKACN